MPIIELPKPIEFEWNEGNYDKNLIKHQVSNQECEEVFGTDKAVLAQDFIHSISEPRYIIIGPTKGFRVLYIVFTIRSNRIRVISARDTNKKERRFYEEALKASEV